MLKFFGKKFISTPQTAYNAKNSFISVKNIFKKNPPTEILEENVKQKVKSGFFSQFLGKRTRLPKLRYLLLGGILGYVGYHWHPEIAKIRLEYVNNEYNRTLVPKLSHLYNQYFYPTLYLALPPLQFLIVKFGHNPLIHYDREILTLSDGGKITLDWALPKKSIDIPGTHIHTPYYHPFDAPKDTKIVFMLHGLTGGSDSQYMKVVVEEATRKGYRVVIMNQRGVNQPLATHLPYHSGKYEDIDEAIQHIIKKYPNAPISAMGFSMGGSQMVRYIGSKGKNTKIESFVSIAPPFDVKDCIDNMKGNIYEQSLLGGYLRNNFIPHIHVISEPLKNKHNISVEDVLSAKSLREYHSLYTVPVYGHKDVDEFFDSTKIHDHHIEGIAIPTLILRAKDDPISVHKGVPFDAMKKNSNIIYAETATGAHLCWVTGSLPKNWYAEPVVEFLDEIHKMKYPNEQLN